VGVAVVAVLGREGTVKRKVEVGERGPGDWKDGIEDRLVSFEV
jgi:hypothetical protein